MKVFLTGASGFLGSHIAELILKKNIELHVLVNKTPLPKFLSKKNIKIINSDLLKVNNLKKNFLNLILLYIQLLQLNLIIKVIIQMFLELESLQFQLLR